VERAMRIERIAVKKLFGIFDHDIHLNADARMTIIHAPNGYGKTVLFKMLNGLFNARYSELRSVPFDVFSIYFSDGRWLEVSKDGVSGELSKVKEIKIKIFQDGKEHRSSTLKISPDEESKIPLSILEEQIDGLTRISRNEWLYEPSGEQLDLDEVFERFRYALPKSFGRIKEDQVLWFKEIKDSIQIYLIESQRLFDFSDNPIRRYASRPISATMPKLAVKAYSDELVQSIERQLASYASVSSSLDRTFPNRVLAQDGKEDITKEDLKAKINRLEAQRTRLIESGVLDRDENSNFQIQNQEIDDSTKRILAVYARDTEEKLGVFGDIPDRIELFKRVVNKKFSYKEIGVNSREGLVLRSRLPDGVQGSGQSLPPASLSSGEQHELVLLYELLFRVKKNTLVLVDEPELSLHVGWQVDFLSDFQEIAKLAELDILIATHSPSLINNRWDLTVELKGP
jgi:energy-coupling factor transporter ATP-binding protein EcfA2